MSEDERYGGINSFAASLNSRLGNQARISKAIGFAWLCGGLAIAACLTASGVAFAFLGYSYMVSIKPTADEIARALASALQSSDFKANVTGNVALSPKVEGSIGKRTVDQN